MSFVLDASVSLTWCFEDEQTQPVLDLLDRVTDTGATAPLLWPVEAMNGLFAAERRHRLDGPRRATLAAFLRELPIRLDSQTADHAWQATARLAETFKLTVYHASYLELAQRRGLQLASLDKALRKAAMSAGVDVLGQAA